MALKSLFDNYKEFEEIISKKKENGIDLDEIGIVPTIILPLLCECMNQNLKLNDGNSAFDYLVGKLDVNSFSRLPKSREESDECDFITKYLENIDSIYGGYFALRTIISELANNVYDHSVDGDNVVQSYILSNLNGDKLDISIIDDGLSIPGRFEKYGVDFENDCYAIEKSIGTFSTISNAQYERGNGLWTVIRLVAEGNCGEMLIVSRGGCLHIDGEYYKYYLLDEKHKLNGTLVSIRLNKYEVQNVYDLIEFNKPDSYRIGEINDY